MNYTRNRKYPVVYKKKSKEQNDNIVDLSTMEAIGILAVTFVGGTLSGYLIRRLIRN